MFQLIKSWRKFSTPDFDCISFVLILSPGNFSINFENPGNLLENFLWAVTVERHMEFPKMKNLRIFPESFGNLPGNSRNFQENSGISRQSCRISEKIGFPNGITGNYSENFEELPKFPGISGKIQENPGICRRSQFEARKFSTPQNAVPTGNHGKPLISLVF